MESFVRAENSFDWVDDEEYAPTGRFPKLSHCFSAAEPEQKDEENLQEEKAAVEPEPQEQVLGAGSNFPVPDPDEYRPAQSPLPIFGILRLCGTGRCQVGPGIPFR